VDINLPPVPQNLVYSAGNYCLESTALKPIFSWLFTDPNPSDVQSAYQVQVADDDKFNPLSIVIDSGKVNSNSVTYAPVTPLPSYNTTYYWRVRVWDNYSSDPGDWTTAGSSFQTPKHAYPKPNFALFPPMPTKDEIVQLCAVQSAVCPAEVARCYNDAGSQISCSGASFSWSLPPDAIYLDGTNNFSSNPKIQLPSIGNRTFTLSLTDNTLPATCSYSETIKVVPTPRYKPIW
jgi:hypothetical protein